MCHGAGGRGEGGREGGRRRRRHKNEPSMINPWPFSVPRNSLIRKEAADLENKKTGARAGGAIYGRRHR